MSRIKIICLLLLLHLPLLGNYKTPRYIWNLGLAIECDINPFKNGLPENYQTNPPLSCVDPINYVKDVKDGDIIWLQTHQVAHFYHNVLPNINSDFVLLINDGDRSFPSSYRSEFNVDALINDDHVIHIFSQNVSDSTSSKKVSGIPIGMDFHTVTNSNNCIIFSETQQSVYLQEQKLEYLLSQLLPTNQRINKAYVDFQLADRGEFDGESRTSIFNQLHKTELIDYPSGRIPRQLLWQTKGKYAFSISPRGAGLDCHRTWEDLVLGCIVIVKTSPLDPLYEGLPVVIVKDWSEITPQNYDKWLKEYGNAFNNPSYRERLTNQYWMNVIRATAKKYNGDQIKENISSNTPKQELDELIPPEIKNDEFYTTIYLISRTEPIKTILEIGSSSGEGSTEAFAKGIRENPSKPILYCMEVSKPRFAALSKHYENEDRIKCYNVSSVPISSFPKEEDVKKFYLTTHTNLNNYPLEKVLGWLKQDINYIKLHQPTQNGINLIKQENGIKNFDIVLIDGSEFTGMAELDLVYGAKFILLDDINSFKNYSNYKKMLADNSYELFSQNINIRNGFAIFKLKDYTTRR
ncbi:MAG: hypothetical protein H0W88_03335 [Parachlamydiaceae bacterium]|nr:hypothetical protein [Parachlamydiaceae bacterium]